MNKAKKIPERKRRNSQNACVKNFFRKKLENFIPEKPQLKWGSKVNVNMWKVHVRVLTLVYLRITSLRLRTCQALRQYSCIAKEEQNNLRSDSAEPPLWYLRAEIIQTLKRNWRENELEECSFKGWQKAHRCPHKIIAVQSKYTVFYFALVAWKQLLLHLPCYNIA